MLSKCAGNAASATATTILRCTGTKFLSYHLGQHVHSTQAWTSWLPGVGLGEYQLWVKGAKAEPEKEAESKAREKSEAKEHRELKEESQTEEENK